MCHSTLAENFSLFCNVALYSGSGFPSCMQCVFLQWMWVSLWYAMCHSTVAEGFSLIYSASLYSGSGFLSGMQCVTIQWPLVSLCNAICHSTVYLELSLVAFSHSTAAVGYSLVCNGSLISGRGFLSGMLFVSIQWPWFSIWYSICNSAVVMGSFCYAMCYSQWQWVSLWYAMWHSTLAVGLTLLCNVSL